MKIGFYDIETDNIEDGILQNMLKDVVVKMKFTSMGDLSNISLVADYSNVVLTNGAQKVLYTHVPYDIRIDGENKEIHGNMRNKIVKRFVEQFSIEHILQLEKEYINMQIEEKNQAEIELNEIEQIFDNEIRPLFTDEFLQDINTLNRSCGEPIVKNYAIVKIEFQCNFVNPLDKYNDGYRNSIEIFFDNHNLKQFSMLTNDKHSIDEYKNNLTLEQVKSECKRVIMEIEGAIVNFKELQVQADAEAERKQKLRDFIWGMFTDDKVTTILRKKNIFIAIRNGMKFSVGDGKMGKFYSITYNKLLDMVINKGYAEYYKQKQTEDGKNICWFKTDELKQLPFKKIAGLSS